eukprot:140457-Chlamydomonas_euryale.AAC.4
MALRSWGSASPPTSWPQPHQLLLTPMKGLGLTKPYKGFSQPLPGRTLCPAGPSPVLLPGRTLRLAGPSLVLLPGRTLRPAGPSPVILPGPLSARPDPPLSCPAAPSA